MTLILPRLNRPTSGMTFRKGVWCVTWTEDGQPRQKSLGTSELEIAKILRDEEREALVQRGAIVRTNNRKTIEPDGMRYIYRRPPFEVKLPDRQHLGFFETEEAAREARNQALGIS